MLGSVTQQYSSSVARTCMHAGVVGGLHSTESIPNHFVSSRPSFGSNRDPFE